MRFSCRTIYEMRCELCEQNISTEEADEERVMIALVGHVAYAKCPVCGRSTADFCKDPEWQRKVRMWVFTHQGKIMRVT
jgi:hypothetical protein